eukprot:g333.t1
MNLFWTKHAVEQYTLLVTNGTNKTAAGQTEAADVTQLFDITMTLPVVVVAGSFGALGDRFGRRPMLFVAALGSVILSISQAVVASFGLPLRGLVPAYLVYACSGGPSVFFGAAFAAAADLTRGQKAVRSAYFGLLEAMIYLGNICGPLASAAIIATPALGSYHGSLIGATILSAVVLLGVLLNPETLSKEHRAAGFNWCTSNTLGATVTVLRLCFPAGAWLLLALISSALAYFGFVLISGLYARALPFDMNPTQVSYLTSANAAAKVFAVFVVLPVGALLAMRIGHWLHPEGGGKSKSKGEGEGEGEEDSSSRRLAKPLLDVAAQGGAGVQVPPAAAPAPAPAYVATVVVKEDSGEVTTNNNKQQQQQQQQQQEQQKQQEQPSDRQTPSIDGLTFDMAMMISGSAGFIIGFALCAIARTRELLFAGAIVSGFGVLVTPTIRSLLSKMVDESVQATVLAAVAGVESIAIFGSATIFFDLYGKTVGGGSSGTAPSNAAASAAATAAAAAAAHPAGGVQVDFLVMIGCAVITACCVPPLWCRLAKEGSVGRA